MILYVKTDPEGEVYKEVLDMSYMLSLAPDSKHRQVAVMFACDNALRSVTQQDMVGFTFIYQRTA